MKRIAIILDKSLEKGEVGNIAAILMGQAALCCQEIYDSEILKDQDGNRHAAIRYSTVVLNAGQQQLLSFIQKIQNEHTAVTCIVFSQAGQKLHNAFPEYRSQIHNNTTEHLKPIGVIVVGAEEEIKAITKKFSLIR